MGFKKQALKLSLPFLLSQALALQALQADSFEPEMRAKSKKAPKGYSLLEETAETRSIVSLLKVYEVSSSEGPIQLLRIGKANDGGYVIPVAAMQKASAVLGYGISTDISFETAASSLFGLPSYGFDCTCPPVYSSLSLFHFIPQCIGSHASLVNRPKEGFSSFSEQIEILGLQEEKLFVKMDIEGSEYETLPDILEKAPLITGIALEIHFMQDNEIVKALDLLQRLNKDFVLIHLHGNNCCDLSRYFVTGNSRGMIPRVLELTYINRNLVQSYKVSPNQAHPTALDMPNDPSRKDVFFMILN